MLSRLDEHRIQEVKTFMKRVVWTVSLIFVLVLLSAASDAGQTGKGWTKAEAQAKVGKRVRYEQASNSGLLQWGPIKKNGRRTLQKPLGRGVKPGSTGTVTDVVLDRMRGYEVIVEWDPDPKDNAVWESGLYKDTYGLVVEIH